MRLVSLALCLIMISPVTAQTLGGTSVYNFLKLPGSPQLTALGGINLTMQNNDVSLAFNNPSELQSSLHGHLHTSFNRLYAGISAYHLTTAIHSEQWQTTFGIGVQYLSYGSVPQTDASGNQFGEFKPRDYQVQVSAGRAYGQFWRYGLNLKFINSQYAQYRSSGIAADMAVTYHDSARQITASLQLRNMGGQLSTYQGSSPDDLPFDIQVGVSGRLKNAPLQFSMTAHSLHRWNLYNQHLYDSVERNDGSFSFDNIFSHFVFAGQVFLSDKLEFSLSYNHLRRKELAGVTSGDGLVGLAAGIGLTFPHFQLRYARGYYQPGVANSHFGLNIDIGKVSGYRKLFK